MLTFNQYTLIEYLFEYYNHALFQGQLKNCFIGMSRNPAVQYTASRFWRYYALPEGKKFKQQKDPFQNTVRSLSDLWILVVKNAQKQCFCAFFA